MQFAIFGIENDGLNLAVTLVLLMFVAVYFALIAWTYLDARRRVDDGVLVGCAAAAAFFFPFIGAAVYSILRPPEFLEDAHERELEIRAAELRVRQLSELSCPNCMYPIEKSYLRCPQCQRRLKDPCQSCGKPVDPRWSLCPFCEKPLPGRQRQERRPASRQARPERSEAPPEKGRREGRDKRPASREKPAPEAPQPSAEKRQGAREGRPAAADERQPSREERRRRRRAEQRAGADRGEQS